MAGDPQAPMISTQNSAREGKSVFVRWSWYIRRLFRTEYFAGLFIGAIATIILWYNPESSGSINIVALSFLYAGSLYSSGFLANAIGDRKLDLIYENFKRDIPRVVEEIGRRRLVYTLVGMLASSLILGYWLSLLVNSLIPLVSGVIGIITGIGYSLRPFRWKIRGFISHAVSLSISAFFLPVFLVSGLLAGGFTIRLVWFALGYTMVHYALEIGNQIKDYEKDVKQGVCTLPSRSLFNSCVIALILLALGLLMEIAALTIIFQLAFWQTIVITILLGLAHSGPFQVYLQAVVIDRKQTPMIEGFKRVTYARWQTAAMLGYFFAALFVRFVVANAVLL